MVAGDLRDAGVLDGLADHDRLAVDADDVIDELIERRLIGVGQLVLDGRARIADVDLLIHELLDTGAGVAETDVDEEGGPSPLLLNPYNPAQ